MPASTRWYVRKTGNDDTGDGLTAGTAYLTLAKVKTVLVSGDTIDIGAGTWSELFSVTTINLIIEGAGKTLTTIIGNPAVPGAIVDLYDGNFEISGVLIKAVTGLGYALTLTTNDIDATLILEDARLESDDGGLGFAGTVLEMRRTEIAAKEYGAVVVGTDITIQNCTISTSNWTTCGTSALHMTTSGGICLVEDTVISASLPDTGGRDYSVALWSATGEQTFRRCTFTASAGVLPEGYDGTSAVLTVAAEVSTLTFEDCTFTTVGEQAYSFDLGNGTTVCTNCTINSDVLKRRGGTTTLTLAGRTSLGGNITLANITTVLAGSLLAKADLTIDGAGATSIVSNGAIITGYSAPVTISNMTACTGTIFARRWVDGTGNGTKVQNLAPHWSLGVR